MDAVNAQTRERGNAGSPDATGALLLAHAHAAGLVVLVAGDRLTVRGPAAAGAVVAALGRHKGAVLAGFPRYRVTALPRSRVGVAAADGLAACADCGRECYAAAGFPPLCWRCLRERAGLPPAWWEAPGFAPAPRPRCGGCATPLVYAGEGRWYCPARCGCRPGVSATRPCFLCGGTRYRRLPDGRILCAACSPAETQPRLSLDGLFRKNDKELDP